MVRSVLGTPVRTPSTTIVRVGQVAIVSAKLPAGTRCN